MKVTTILVYTTLMVLVGKSCLSWAEGIMMTAHCHGMC